MTTLVYPSQSFDSLGPKSHQPTLFNSSSNGKSISRHDGGHMWWIDFSHDSMFRSQFAQIDGFLSYVGKRKKFLVVPPDRAIPRGVATGTPAVDNAAGYAEDTDTINLKGLTPSVTNWFMEGDFFKFNSFSKVHMCVQNLDSDVSGNGVLIFEPPLPQDIADGELLTVTNVPFQVVCVNNHSYQVSNGGQHKTNGTFMEAA